MKRMLLSVMLLRLTLSFGFAEVIVDFSDLSLTNGVEYWNGADGAGEFRSRAVSFGNHYNTDWGAWEGFAYSRVNDPETPGWGNQYAVISGTGVGGTGIYAIGYTAAESPSETTCTITLPVASPVRGVYVNNTTYVALDVEHGSAFSKKFGGETGDDPDWFRLTVVGYDSDGISVGSNTLYLADYRFENNAENYILHDWTWLNLTNLGDNVKILKFSLASSDVGAWGMNTPAYFALGRLVTDEHYAPAAGQPGSTAIAKDSDLIIGWATGWTNYIVGDHVDPFWQTPHEAVGPASGTSTNIVCLGDGGQITMTFDPPIRNAFGPDFAVFENAFDDHFLELAYVEVSSDGTNFARFFNRSLTPEPVPFMGAALFATNIHGLAGKYRQGFGVPFDLSDLAGAPGLDINCIGYVRLIDIVGDGSYTDSVGHVIYDPHPNEQSAGFDLDAIGVLRNDFYWLETVAGPYGTVDPTGGIWVGEGSNVVITAIPDADYHFSHWSGDVEEDQKSDNPVSLIMDGAKSLKAHFAPSFLSIVEVSMDTGSGLSISWPGNTIGDSGYYEIHWRADFGMGEWQVISAGIPREDGIMTWTADTPVAGRGFYRIESDEGEGFSILSQNVVGYDHIALEPGLNLVAFPFQKITAARGVVSANTGTTIADAGATWTAGYFNAGVVGSEPTGASTFYIEITSGAFEGRHFYIESHTDTTLTLAGGLPADIDANELVGAAYKIVAANRIRDLFGEPGEPRIEGGASSVVSDTIYMWNGVMWDQAVYYKAGGVPIGCRGHWNRGTNIVDDLVIDRDQAVFVLRRASEPLTLPVVGEVSANHQSIELNSGLNLVGGLSVVDELIGPSMLTDALAGGDSAAVADNVLPWTGAAWDMAIYFKNSGMPTGNQQKWNQGATIVDETFFFVPVRGYFMRVRGSQALGPWIRPSPLSAD